MSTTATKFSNRDTEFFKSMRESVEGYFTESGVRKTGDLRLYTKTVVLMALLVTLYIVLVFFTPPTWIALVLCALMGVNISAIGFNVMHDGAHGSYSSKKWVNEVMAYSLNFLGGNTYIWKLKHNINHHTFTNIEGVDDDIDIRPFIRTHEGQPKHWFHRFQHYYALFLYCLTYIFWIFFNDLNKYFSGNVAHGAPMKRMDLKEHVIFWVSKLVNWTVFLVIPILSLGWLSTLVGYLVMMGAAGFMLAVVFQLAHVVDDSEFVKPVEEVQTELEHGWAVHQLMTTANFATDNKFLNWLLGGLNFQIEHHLFPRISHVHYPEISKRLKKVCADFQMPYREFRTTRSALWSHLMHLKHVGVA